MYLWKEPLRTPKTMFLETQEVSLYHSVMGELSNNLAKFNSHQKIFNSFLMESDALYSWSIVDSVWVHVQCLRSRDELS